MDIVEMREVFDTCARKIVTLSYDEYNCFLTYRWRKQRCLGDGVAVDVIQTIETLTRGRSEVLISVISTQLRHIFAEIPSPHVRCNVSNRRRRSGRCFSKNISMKIANNCRVSSSCRQDVDPISTTTAKLLLFLTGIEVNTLQHEVFRPYNS